TDEMIQHMHHAPINLAGKTTLNQLAAVLACCDVYIGADSGVMHLAAASPPASSLRAIFGPSNHLAWMPRTGSASLNVIRRGVLCSPCSYVGHTVGLRHGHEARTCMKLIQPTDVIAGPDGSARNCKQRAIRARETEPALQVLGVPVDNPTFESMLDQIGTWIKGKTPRQICTVNPEFIMVAQKDINFYNILNRCDLCIPDGTGLLWA